MSSNPAGSNINKLVEYKNKKTIQSHDNNTKEFNKLVLSPKTELQTKVQLHKDNLITERRSTLQFTDHTNNHIVAYAAFND